MSVRGFRGLLFGILWLFVTLLFSPFYAVNCWVGLRELLAPCFKVWVLKETQREQMERAKTIVAGDIAYRDRHRLADDFVADAKQRAVRAIEEQDSFLRRSQLQVDLAGMYLLSTGGRLHSNPELDRQIREQFERSGNVLDMNRLEVIGGWAEQFNYDSPERRHELIRRWAHTIVPTEESEELREIRMRNEARAVREGPPRPELVPFCSRQFRFNNASGDDVRP